MPIFSYKASDSDIVKIVSTVFEKNKEGALVVNKSFVGKNASDILNRSGIPNSKDYKLIIAEVEFKHPLVFTEMLMPILPSR